MGDKVMVITGHELVGLIGYVVGYDSNFHEIIIQEKPKETPRLVIHVDYLVKLGSHT